MKGETCNMPGCNEPAVKSYPVCMEHMHRGEKCHAEGCERTIAAYNRTGYCYDHRYVGQKMKRLRADEARERGL